MGIKRNFIASCGCKNLHRSKLPKRKINGNPKLVCPNHSGLKKGIIKFVIIRCADCNWSFYSNLHGYHRQVRCKKCQKEYAKEQAKNRAIQGAVKREKEQTANKKSKYQRGNSIDHKDDDDGFVPYNDPLAMNRNFTERSRHGGKSFT